MEHETSMKEIKQRTIILAISLTAIFTLGFIGANFVGQGSAIYKGIVGATAVLSLLTLGNLFRIIKCLKNPDGPPCGRADAATKGDDAPKIVPKICPNCGCSNDPTRDKCNNCFKDLIAE